ncbi:hypothetical protein [Actinoalloteichus spitiensis]|uniref:hypothetical protein n=1 Tax=Actinoalloteichus spitiensis TaxID=252394 RepID=UPI0003791435|nr:hypothetical protein [Actinoalloteichus spitiensis]
MAGVPVDPVEQRGRARLVRPGWSLRPPGRPDLTGRGLPTTPHRGGVPEADRGTALVGGLTVDTAATPGGSLGAAPSAPLRARLRSVLADGPPAHPLNALPVQRRCPPPSRLAMRPGSRFAGGSTGPPAPVPARSLVGGPAWTGNGSDHPAVSSANHGTCSAERHGRS